MVIVGVLPTSEYQPSVHSVGPHVEFSEFLMGALFNSWCAHDVRPTTQFQESASVVESYVYSHFDTYVTITSFEY